MDDFDRFMIRQRALRRARLSEGDSRALWNFAHWGDGATEDHHPGRRKFTEELTVTVPAAMHPELTRRGEEEHPPLGSDPANELEQLGRLHLGLSDMHAGLSGAHREVGKRIFTAVERGACDIGAVQIPKGLLGWMARIAHDVERVAKGLTGALDEG